MAERRMFAKSIINSGRFLRMPPTSRLLYYDLGMAADDDGIVEAYSVMAQTKATDDDLRVLVAKGFIRILNDDLVSLICDWNTNNAIRSDRYHRSIYAELLEPVDSCQPTDNQMSVKCQSSDSQMSDNCHTEVRLGKVSIVKDSIGGSKGEEKSSPAPTKKARHRHGEYNHVLLTDEEYEKLISDYGKDTTEEYIRKVDEYCEVSGRTYKNYNLAIRNTFMRKDGIRPKVVEKQIPDEQLSTQEQILNKLRC